MGEVFITRKGGGRKAAAPTLAVTSVGGSFVQLAVTNNDQTNQATIFILANYDTNSTTDFDILAAQSGTVINVAAGTTVSTIVSGLDPDTSHTVSASAAVIKKLLSNIVTTDTINLAGTGVTAPTVGPITENLFTSTTFTVTNNDTVVSQIIKANITESTTVPSVYPFESSTLAAEATGSITVSDLTSATVYYIHARAFDGTFSSSNVMFGPYTQSSPIVATGGTTEEYDSGGKRYKSHTFTSGGTFSVTFVPTGLVGFDVVDVLVVAGGGSGGGHASPGGGGAGGLVYKTSQSVTTTNYGITVGAGGPQSSSQGSYVTGNKGANSTAFSLTAVGGGGGVTWGGSNNLANSINGGSTGGYGQGGAVNSGVPTAQQTLQSGESGSLGFGNRGGVANSGYTVPYPGGGGGGAGAVGATAPNGSTAGAGGVGRQYDIRNGTLVYYAGGGGGGGWGLVSGMLGGLGGGGRGDCPAVASTGTGNPSSRGFTNRSEGEAGAVNTGGGGGAAGRTGGELSIGGAGGSGIVVIRYEIAPV